MNFKITRDIFLSLSTLLVLGCGQSTPLTPSMKTSHISTQSLYSPLHISEVLASNAQSNYDPDFKKFSDWIEIYNDSNKSIDLSRYYLSDSKKNLQKWQFPNNTIINAHEYLLVWADGKNCIKQALHTNFKLSSDGEQIIFSDANGKIIDALNFSETKGDISIGISNGIVGYMLPTPSQKNSTAYANIRQTEQPAFSLRGGFYQNGQTVTLSAPKDAQIFYTLDGSTPTKESKPYTAPIEIDTTTVVRAIALKRDIFPSKVTTQTYFIDENITLPVISLAIDKKYLEDEKCGIWKHIDQDWMRAGNIEFIKEGQEKFNQKVGLKLHGHFSRTYPIKSLTIMAKEKYEKDFIDYPIFRDKPEIKKVKSFVLRNSGNDWGTTLLRDGFVHTVAKELSNIDYLSYEPTVVFINGEYYGIMNLRENPNKHYLRANNNLGDKKVNLLKFRESEQPEVISGDRNAYNHLIEYITSHDLTIEENYNYIASQFDIDEFINYTSLELFINNVDWMARNNNMGLWRTKNSKWRWILYDTDISLGLVDPINHTFEMISASNDRLKDVLSAQTPTAKLFQALLSNQNFKERFVARFQRLLDTTFRPEHLQEILDRLSARIAPEIERHLERWQISNLPTYESWESEIETISDFIHKRPNYMRHFIQNDLY